MEKTFEKLYYRYVKQDSTTDPQSPSEKAKPRTFISHSEAEEEDSSEEEQSPTELDSSFAEKLETMRHKKGDVSVTPNVSARNSPDATPKCSPMMLRKRDDEQTVEKKPVEEKTGAMKLDKVDSKSPAEVFREKHSNLEFIPVEVPSTTLKPVTSAMDKFLRRDSLTTKLSDAIEKKRASISNGDSGTTKAIKEVSPTPSRSISPNVAPLRAKNDLPSENLPNSTESPATKEQSPMPAKGSDSSHSAKVSLSLSASNNNGKNGASKNPADSNVGKDISLEAEENTETCQKSKEAPEKSRPKSAEPPKAALPIVVSTSVENAISTNAETPSKTEEPTVTVTIPLSGLKQRNRSRSASPGRRAHRDRKENTPQLLTIGGSGRSGHHESHRMRHSASPARDRPHSDHVSSNGDDEPKKHRRKRRDPTRTLENLKEKLATEKDTCVVKENGSTRQMSDSTASTGSDESGSMTKIKNGPRPPLLLITEPTSPQKTCSQLWEESTDGDWTEAEDEADYESDFEYSVSQTFNLRDAMPLGDLYPLSRSSSRCSPFVSDYDSDGSMPLFKLPSRAEDSRGRVDRLFAVPPPSFTCSITYDGQESWDDDSLHSCTELDDEYYGRQSRFSRTGSSALGAYLSPSTFSSDEDYDGMHYHDEVEVGCTLRLVDKAAMRGDSEDDDSEYYEDEEFTDEEYWDEDEEYGEDEEEYQEEEEELEVEEGDEEEEEQSCDEMHSFSESAEDESRRSPFPLVVVHPAEEEEEYVDMEHVDAEFEIEATVELVHPEPVPVPKEKPEAYREVTYTKDLSLMNEEENAEQLRIEQDEAAKAIKKRVIKDGMSEKAAAVGVSHFEEEYVNEEEMDAEFDVDTAVEHAQPQVVEQPEEKMEKYREVTYTKDLSLMTEEEKAEQLRIEQDQAAKAVKKKVVKDGASEKADASRVPQRVVPAEETVAFDESTALPDEEICELGLQQHEDETGTHEVNVVLTYVRPQTAKVVEESTSRFADKRVATDFAKKAVIQPTKLQTAAVQKVETKVAPEKPVEPPPSKKPNEKDALKKADEATAKEPTNKSAERKIQEPPKKTEPAPKAEPSKTTEKPSDALKTKVTEDKSGIRKSALNMAAEDAKKKLAADEEAARQKARRLGTVSSMLNRFKEPEIKEEPITYKRSAYLAAKDVEGEKRPKKKYEVIKPAVDDSFDKQMEEIRAQMKTGSSKFESHLKDLSKGITISAEDVKKRAEDEKKKMIIDSVSGVFSKADEEKARWKERREAETEKELAKIEADKRLKKKTVVEQPKAAPEKPAEPKRTVRKIIKDKAAAAPAAAVPTFATVPKPPSAATAPSTAKPPSSTSTTAAAKAAAPAKPPTPTPAAPSTVSSVSSARPLVAPTTPAEPKKLGTTAATAPTPSVKPTGMEKLNLPKNDAIINEDNYDLFEAATNVATRRRKSLAELQARKEQQAAARSVAEQNEVMTPVAKPGPKGDGAAATKIRNALGNATNVRKPDSPSPKPEVDKPSKRYATRRKTQEIVNESAEPKIKKRKQLYKRNRFIRDPHDIDVLLGWDKENTFEKMEQMFSQAAKDRISRPEQKKRKRAPASKVWISDLTDIDKIYKASEIRDIIASVNV